MSLTLGGRLKQLSGLSGATVGAMLAVIGGGTTLAQCLPSYSGLASGTVGDHLRVDRAPPQPEPGFGAVHRPYVKRRPFEEDEALLLAVLH